MRELAMSKIESSMITIEDLLPRELLLEIFEKCDRKDLKNCLQVNNRWRSLIESKFTFNLSGFFTSDQSSSHVTKLLQTQRKFDSVKIIVRNENREKLESIKEFFDSSCSKHVKSIDLEFGASSVCLSTVIDLLMQFRDATSISLRFLPSVKIFVGSCILPSPAINMPQLSTLKIIFEKGSSSEFILTRILESLQTENVENFYLKSTWFYESANENNLIFRYLHQNAKLREVSVIKATSEFHWNNRTLYIRNFVDVQDEIVRFLQNRVEDLEEVSLNCYADSPAFNFIPRRAAKLNYLFVDLSKCNLTNIQGNWVREQLKTLELNYLEMTERNLKKLRDNFPNVEKLRLFEPRQFNIEIELMIHQLFQHLK